MSWLQHLGAFSGAALSKGAEEYYGRRDEEREDLYNQALEYNKLIGPQNFNQGQVQQFHEGLQGNRVVDDRLRRRLGGLQQLGEAQVKTDAQKMAELAGMEGSAYMPEGQVKDLMRAMNMDVESQQVEGWHQTQQPTYSPRGTTPGGIGSVKVPAAMGTDPSQGWQYGGLVPGSNLQQFMDTQEARRGALADQAHHQGEVAREIELLDQEAVFQQVYGEGGHYVQQEQAELVAAVNAFKTLNPLERKARIDEYGERLGLDRTQVKNLYHDERALTEQYLPELLKEIRKRAWAAQSPTIIQTMGEDGRMQVETLFPFTGPGTGLRQWRRDIGGPQHMEGSFPMGPMERLIMQQIQGGNPLTMDDAEAFWGQGWMADVLGGNAENVQVTPSGFSNIAQEATDLLQQGADPDMRAGRNQPVTEDEQYRRKLEDIESVLQNQLRPAIDPRAKRGKGGPSQLVAPNSEEARRIQDKITQLQELQFQLAMKLSPEFLSTYEYPRTYWANQGRN
jgi:hypothetical protein